MWHDPCCVGGQLKCDGTRKETRFRLSAKQTSPFKSAEASVQSTTGSWGVHINSSNAAYTMFRGSVKGTGYPLHSPVSPSLPLPCVTVCRHISTGVYHTEFLDSQRALLESFVRYFGNRMSFIHCSMTLCYWNINTQLLVTIVSCFCLCCMSAVTLHRTCCMEKCGMSNTWHS